MSDKSPQKFIAATPFIKAVRTTEALIPEGHVHDDRYVRYDDAQSLASGEVDQFLRNINSPPNADGVILRLDTGQTLTITSKTQGRTNIGIIDDLNITTPEGNINLSALVTNAGDLVGSVVRYDQAQTLSSDQAAQFASNAKVITSSPGVSTQTISTALNINGSELNLPNGPVLSKGGSFTGTLNTSSIAATVKIADPLNENLRSAIRVTVGDTTNADAMHAGGASITNVKTPTELQTNHAATVEFVTNQIIGLDLAGNYLTLNGTNQMAGNITFAPNSANHTVKNLGRPSTIQDAQRAGTAITYIGSEGESSILSAGDLTAEPGSLSVTPASNQTHFVNFGSWNGGDVDPSDPTRSRGMIVREDLQSGLYRVMVQVSSNAVNVNLAVGGSFATGSTTNLNTNYEQTLTQEAGETKLASFEFYVPITDGVLNIHKAVGVNTIQRVVATRISETTNTAIYRGNTLISGVTPV
jgi:hypothetical protein